MMFILFFVFRSTFERGNKKGEQEKGFSRTKTCVVVYIFWEWSALVQTCCPRHVSEISCNLLVWGVVSLRQTVSSSSITFSYLPLLLQAPKEGTNRSENIYFFLRFVDGRKINLIPSLALSNLAKFANLFLELKKKSRTFGRKSLESRGKDEGIFSDGSFILNPKL